MITIRQTYSFENLLPTLLTVEETMGYKPGETPEPVIQIATQVLEELSGSHEAKSEYKIFDDISFNQAEHTLRIENKIFNIHKIIFGQLKKAASAALFICTAGEVTGARSRSLMQSGDLLKGYIYDLIGSIVVESAADMMQKELKERMAAEGYNITNRFSPGYCGWNVSEQHNLFSFFPDNFCRITLTPSALMSPVKSVSGIIGIGSAVRYAPYQCRLCDDKNCLYRRKSS